MDDGLEDQRFRFKRALAVAIGGVSLAVFLWILEVVNISLPIQAILVLAIASLCGIGYGIYGFFQFRPRITVLSEATPMPSVLEVLEALETVSPSQQAAPSSNPASFPHAGLKELLQEELRQGENLRQRLPDYFGSLRSMMGDMTTESDVDWWQDRIRSLLESEPLKQARFMSDPHELFTAATSLAMLDPLKRRLEHRLVMLAQIVQEL